LESEELTPSTALEKYPTPMKGKDVEASITIPPEKVQRPEPISQLEDENCVPIKAPMLGTFYRAAKPDAPPFVEVGQLVTKEDVVCIIEVMKLFNMVRAGVQGRIAKICAENTQLVEYHQVLFLVEKEDG
jgi:acetyl-CoA carboxylase biotin carboxyl carrier protein